MKFKFKMWILSTLLIFFIGGCGSGGNGDGSGGSSSSSPKFVNTYYPADVGFTWTYRVTPSSGSQYNSVSTVTQASTSGFLIKTQVDNATVYSTTDYVYDNSSLNMSTSSSYSSDGSLTSQSVYSPAAIVLPLDMTTGSIESTTSSVTIDGKTTLSRLRSIVVNGIETVTVPAGTATATKLTLTVTDTPISGEITKMIYSYWYVENVGRVKTTFYSTTSPSEITTYEMTAYSLVKTLDTIAPTDGTLTATPASPQVSLSWRGFSDSGGIAGYKLVYSTESYPPSCNSGTQIYSGTNTSYTHASLTDGITYYYRVCATDIAGNVSGGAIVSTTIKAIIPPSGWSYGSNMPTARYWAASAVIGNDIYVMGDIKNEKYNTITNSWTTLPDMPFSDFLLRGATVNGKIYIFGGYMSSNVLVYRYDPSTGIWTKLNNMPYMSDMGAPAVVNNKVYIFGGTNSSSTVTNMALEYDPSTDTWSTKAAMPTARYAPSTAVYSNKIYVMGGNYVNTKNEVYDPATNTWQTKASLPFSNYGWGAAGEISGNIYIVDSSTSKMAIYSPSTDSWTEVFGLSTPRNYLTGEVVNGKIYVIGGYTSSSTASNILDIFNPSNAKASYFKSIPVQNTEEQIDYSADYERKHRADELLLKQFLFQ